jgi:stage V sporulation protein D (sporulation-specific penicillin-binding protein)
MKGKTKKITHKRLTAILTLFVFCASYLIFAVFRLDYLKNDYYKEKTYDQVTTSSVLKAERGNIYDSNMNVLAESNTVWRIFVSTRDLKAAEKRDKVDYCKIIADGIAPILSIDTNNLYSKIKNSSVLDVTIEKSATEGEYERIIKYIRANSLESLVFTEAKSSSSYPAGKLAAHVLGFT